MASVIHAATAKARAAPVEAARAGVRNGTTACLAAAAASLRPLLWTRPSTLPIRARSGTYS
eukprot:177381-Chlamydomonas_euryale.AAC.7